MSFLSIFGYNLIYFHILVNMLLAHGFINTARFFSEFLFIKHFKVVLFIVGQSPPASTLRTPWHRGGLWPLGVAEDYFSTRIGFCGLVSPPNKLTFCLYPMELTSGLDPYLRVGHWPPTFSNFASGGLPNYGLTAFWHYN